MQFDQDLKIELPHLTFSSTMFVFSVWIVLVPGFARYFNIPQYMDFYRKHFGFYSCIGRNGKLISNRSSVINLNDLLLL